MNAVDDHNYAIQSYNQGFCEKSFLSRKQSQAFVFFFSQNSSSSDFLYKTSAQIESFRFEVEND